MGDYGASSYDLWDRIAARQRREEEPPAMIPRSIFFFRNGTAAVFDESGHQLAEYQTGWHGTTIDALKADGIDWREIPGRKGTPLGEPPDWWDGRPDAAIADRDELADVIARAHKALASVEVSGLGFHLGKLGASSVEAFDVTHRIALALEALRTAREILAGGKSDERERTGG